MRFYHRYSYDAENRLTEVETSSDKIYWERDAMYQYYQHGPLSRTVLGEQQVQGVDYSYTLQGWLKSINRTAANLSLTGTGCAEGTGPDVLSVTDRTGDNPPAHYEAGSEINFEEDFENGAYDYFDATVDHNLRACADNTGTTDFGTAGTESGEVARDAYHVILNYYEDDYKGIGVQSPSYGMSAKLGTDYHPLYNGNISSMAVNVGKLGTPMVYAYQYDQLNRLVGMNGYTGNNEAWTTLAPTDNYKEHITYDANGNIIRYQRNGNNSTSPLMDNMTYHYQYLTAGGVVKQYVPEQAIPSDAARLTNRLNYIDDVVDDAVYSNDIDKQSDGNYVYDEIGNLTRDVKGGLSNVEWAVYGKISKIIKTDGTVINYTYDASGNRISKAVTKNSATTTVWYVRDASGTVMSIYTAGDNNIKSGHLTQTEVDLYGSSRLGMLKPEIDVTLTAGNTITLVNGTTGYTYQFNRGNKFFELSNHLGNVLTTISDKKLQHTTDNTTVDYYLPDVATATDYAPFGMQLDGRSFSSGNYRYGFNGKEKSNEINGSGVDYDYGFRIYDVRIGKFLSVDPLTKDYPGLTPYQFASNSPIENSDLDGAESISDIKHSNLVKAELQIKAADFKQKNAEAKIAQQKAMLQSLSQQHATAVQQSPIYSFDEVERREERRAYDQSEAGYNPDGSKKPLIRLAENKTFNKTADNVVIPLMTLDGAYGLYKMGGSLLARAAFSNAIKQIRSLAESSNIEFESISIYTQGNADRFIILGRNQAERVDVFAKQLKAKGFNITTITEDIPGGPTNPLQNGKWLHGRLNEGYSVIDIGLDPGYTTGRLTATGIPDFTYGPYYDFETVLRQTHKFKTDIYIPIKK